VLDDNQPSDDFDVFEQGYLDTTRFNWLINELNTGQNEGKLMIIAAHIPLTLIGYHANSPITTGNLISKLQEYPNLLLWISGHVHRNLVTPIKSTNPNRPELGFWQVETSSLRDFPQQFRLFEIVLNSDKTISIFTTNVDPAVKADSLAEKSRSYIIASQQIFKYYVYLSPTGSYNAELVKQLSPEMQGKLSETFQISNALPAPNPFNPNSEVSHIGYTLNSGATVKLNIYSINGKRIYTAEQYANPGYNEFTWNGHDAWSQIVKNDVYFAVLLAECEGKTAKAILKIVAIKK